MADATDDDLESCSQFDPEEQLPMPTVPKQYTSECEQPGCTDQAGEPCGICKVWFCHGHFGRCHTCKKWPLCGGCLRPPENHMCQPNDGQSLKVAASTDDVDNDSIEDVSSMHSSSQEDDSNYRKLWQDVLKS